MKKSFAFLVITMFFATVTIYAQSNIFDQNDLVTEYNSANPPSLPPANTLAKWVRTKSRITWWDTDKFKPYIWNGMAFRMRFPNNFNPNDNTKKYPVILFLHGAGEIQPIYDNEDQLYWGAQMFQAKIDSGQFNAFMLFPQVSATAWDYTYYTRINSVLDSMQKYLHTDPDRLIAMGLSNGAFGSLAYSANFPQRVSTVISSSPALIQLLQGTINNVLHIPLWIASGGLDDSPGPDVVNNFVDTLAARGGDTRYSFFPLLGHGTWNDMWAEPYLLPYWLNAHTANPIIFNKKSQFCANAVTAKMGITQGFAEYQWRVDGVTIPNSNTNDIIGTQLGSYQARFRRVAGGAWSDWSQVPAIITALPTATSPPIAITGIRSRVLPAPDGSTTTPLELPAGFVSYEWRRASDNVLVSTARTYAAPVGQYIARAMNCNSTFAPAFDVYSANGSAKPDSARDLTLARLSATSIRLNWTDVTNPVSNETGFEIYRAANAGGPYTMAGITTADVRTFTDTAISNNYNFYYRVRAVSTTGASGLSTEVSLQPASDAVAPTAPTNLVAFFTSPNFIELKWTPATDAVGVTAYDVYVNGVKTYTTNIPQVKADQLTPNTAYSFTVYARDQAGNQSTISNSISATSRVNGLKYSYYEGSFTTLPNFSTLPVAQTGGTPNVDLGVRPSGVNQNYAFVWEGYIRIPTPGNYTFETISDDGSKFYYNSFYSSSATPLVSNDGVHGAISATGSVNITDTGLHPIAITFFQQSSGQSMEVYWSGPGISRQLIPNSAFTGTSLSTDVTAPTAPSNLAAGAVTSTTIDLSWTASTDNIGVLAYDVYVGGLKKYTTSNTTITADTLTPNTTYSFTVRARDLAGNTSAVSNAVSASTNPVGASAPGLNYKFYQGSWSTLPDFNALTPAKTGTTANVDLSVRNAGVNDNFGFIWQGYINIPTAGSYTFETNSDDGSSLYFNSLYSTSTAPTVNNDGLHGSTSVTATVSVPTPGYYPIAITYFEKDGGESMQVYWSGPGFSRQTIPNAAFFTTPPQSGSDTTAPSIPGNVRLISTSQNMVSLHWDNSTDNVGVTGYDIYRNGVKKYATTGTDIIADSLLANTAYSFTVVAKDVAGNISVASAAVAVTTINSASANGLNYRYYQGGWNALPNFNALTPVKTGTTPNVDLSVRNRADSFGIVWEGFINIQTPGTYTFETVSDEGSKLYFNSLYSPSAMPLVANDSLHLFRSATGTVAIPAAGQYPIAITYFDKTGADSMKVLWTGPGFARQPIPNAAFTQAGIPAVGDTTAPTVPANLAAGLITTSSIALTWTAATDNIGVVGYDIYVGGIKKYTSVTNSVVADTLLANTSYSFTVRARDLAGNMSAASIAVSATTASNAAGAAGINYKFYQGSFNQLPNFNTLTPVKTGVTPNVDISVRNAGVEDNFAFLWEGYINIPAAGTYTFETNSDDGSKLYFNSLYSPSVTATVNNDGLHGATSVTANVTVATPGYYPIAMTFFDKDGGQGMQAFWSGPGITRQLIPNAVLFSQLPADGTAPTAPTNVTASLINSTFINLTWTPSTDNVGVTGYDVYVNGIKKYAPSSNSLTVDSLTAGTSYVFAIKARDFAGNASAFSADLSVTTSNTTQGLTYKYYQGTWDLLPNFSTLTPVKSGFTPNVDIITNSTQTDNYAYLWEGNITLPATGTYTFETISDDGSRIYFNKTYSAAATALVNNDGVHGPVSATGTVTIAAGSYPIAITFFEKNSGESMQVYWTGPGIQRQLIPNSAFIYVPPVADTVAPSVPTGITLGTTNGTFINLSWTAATDNVGVTGYDVYVNGVKKYNTPTNSVTADGLVPNTSYTITIKALDFSNNASGFSTAFTATTPATTSGLSFKYYEGAWDLLPNFNALTPVKTGTTANLDIITTRNQADNYGYLWEGNITLPTSGTYTFETISDDGSKFYFNKVYSAAATALVNNDGLHGPVSVAGSVTTAAGSYPIAISFFERGSGESMQLYWTGPGITRQLVPNSAFVYSPPVPDSVAPTAPANLAAASANSTFINLTWNASTDNIGVTSYDIYINGVKRHNSITNSVTADGLTANTSYLITVKALDLAGNASAFSSSLTASTTSAPVGLSYKYFQGTWDLLPDFSSLTPVKTGIMPNIDIITTRNQADNYAYLWEGSITLPTSGAYTFETISDDGSKFYFNKTYSAAATALVNNDGIHGAVSATGTVTMAAGVYPIAISFFEKNSGEGMQVYWSGPGIPRQLIPNSAFAGTFTPSVDNTAPSIPANVKAILTTNTYVDISWDPSTDNVGVTGYDVYVNGTKQTTVTNTLFRLSGLTAGQSNSFTIKAVDLATNASASSVPLVVVSAPKANGLKYRYYEGDWNALPNFDLLTPIKTGSSATPDITVRPSTVNDRFGFVWEGYINITTPGTYTFETISDDGSKFYWNTLYNPAATALVNSDGLHGGTSVSASVNVPAAGLYPIAITYFEKDGGETMQVFYSGPGISRQLLPGAAMTSFTGGEAVPMGAALLSSLTTAAADAATTAGLTKAYPNPFTENLTVQYSSVSAASNVSVSIYDMNGRMIQRQLFGKTTPGANSYRINLDKQMMPGMYLIKLDVDGKSVNMWKMVKQKK